MSSWLITGPEKEEVSRIRSASPDATVPEKVLLPVM
jgi:hypothetical protein